MFRTLSRGFGLNERQLSRGGMRGPFIHYPLHLFTGTAPWLFVRHAKTFCFFKVFFFFSVPYTLETVVHDINFFFPALQCLELVLTIMV